MRFDHFTKMFNHDLHSLCSFKVFVFKNMSLNFENSFILYNIKLKQTVNRVLKGD